MTSYFRGHTAIRRTFLEVHWLSPMGTMDLRPRPSLSRRTPHPHPDEPPPSRAHVDMPSLARSSRPSMPMMKGWLMIWNCWLFVVIWFPAPMLHLEVAPQRISSLALTILSALAQFGHQSALKFYLVVGLLTKVSRGVCVFRFLGWYHAGHLRAKNFEVISIHIIRGCRVKVG